MPTAHAHIATARTARPVGLDLTIEELGAQLDGELAKLGEPSGPVHRATPDGDDVFNSVERKGGERDVAGGQPES